MTSQECRYLWEFAKLQYADIEPYDLDVWDDKDGNTLYCVRMIMNCGECNMHLIGPDGVAKSVDDAEDAARKLLIRRWNSRLKN